MSRLHVSLSPLGATAASAAVVFCGDGLIYLLRPLWPGPPALAEALPLDELAGRSAVALPLYLAVWLAAGFVLYELVPAATRSAAAVAPLACYGSIAASLIIVRQVPVSTGLLAALRTPALYLAAAGIVGALVIRSHRPRHAARDNERRGTAVRALRRHPRV